MLADSSDAVNAAEPQPAGATGHEQLATSVFSSDAVRRAMRRNTWCSGRTDEPALDLPGDACARLPVYTNTSRTGVRAGFGAFASRALAEGEYIGEYTGEIIRTAKLDKCDGGGGGGRAESQFVFDLGDGFAVDAQRVGNRLRRANHCGVSPNVRAQVVNHRGVRKVCMYAAAAVAAHEELLFDYGPLFSESLLR
jgi:SET domain-containing protein